MAKTSSGLHGDAIDLIVQVAGGSSTSIVASELRRAGIVVDRELPISGKLGVKGPRSMIGTLNDFPGVKLVREAETIQLPPMSGAFPQ